MASTSDGGAARKEEYVLSAGESAAARLRLLDKAVGASTRSMLREAGLKEGMRVFDLGCGTGTVSCWARDQVGAAGHVVAGDANPDQLRVAQQNCAECGHSPIEYAEVDAYDTRLPSESFDLVHVRLLLAHLKHPEKALSEIHRVLRPGGALVCQDMAISGVFCFPENAAYARSVQLALALGERAGQDFNFGLRLPAAAMDAGFRSVRLRLEHPAYLRGEEKRLWEHSFAEASPAVVRCGLVTQDELEQLLNDMRAAAKDERTLIALWLSLNIIAVK